MARDRNGRFLPGYDAQRHIFSHEQCLAGYTALVEKIQREQACGIIIAKQWAFRRMCKTESIRYSNPAIIPVEPIQLKRARDYRIENGYKP